MEGGVDDENRPWYYDRLMDLDHEGWVTSTIEDFLSEDEQIASERIIYLDFLLDLAQELLERTAYLGSAIDERSNLQIDVWQEELRDPMNAERVLEEYTTWAREWRPWELALDSNRTAWIEADKEEYHAELLARFDALDGSTLPATLVLIPLLGFPGEAEEIEHSLSLLEQDEQRQKSTIQKSAELLNQAGFDVGPVEALPIMEGLDWIARLHELNDLHEDLRLLIVDQIAPFDSELAQHHEQRRLELVAESDRGDIVDFKIQMNSIADNLHQRLAGINDVLNVWRSEGIVFPHKDGVRPEELLEWETNLPEIEGSIRIHMHALRRWNEIAQLWPDETEKGASIAGVLEYTERFIDHVESLDQRWKEFELEAMKFIDHYAGAGLVMEGWSDEVQTNPRSALRLLKKSEHLFEKRVHLIHQLLNIDTSFEGGDKVDTRIRLLKELDVDLEILDDSQQLVDALARRGARHRRLLESDWIELVAQGKANDSVPTSSFTLAQFEDEIARIRQFGVSGDSTTTGGAVVSGGVRGRLSSRIHQELVVLESCGWNVQHLFEELENDSIAAARKVNALRTEVAAYPALVRRFAPLPWNRDIALAYEVQERMRDPTQLRSLSEKIPSFIQHLALRPVEEEGFSMDAWIPAKPRPTLIPVPEHGVRQTMIPQDALGDAHEAMLEAMEVQSEDVVEQVIVEVDVVEKPLEADIVQPVKVVKPLPLQSKTPAAPIVSELQHPLEIEESVYDDISLFLHALNLDDLADELRAQQASALPVVRRALAQHVGVSPRDTRVDRMIRLSLRLLPQSDEMDGARAKMLARIGANTQPLKRWMRARLEHRHSGSADRFLDDAANLGKALKRIPGPGISLPLEPDTYELPGPHDMPGLEREVGQLLSLINLTNAGGVTA